MQHSNDVTLRLVREISNENQPLSQVALHDQLTDILIEGAKLETTIKVADNCYILFLTDVRNIMKPVLLVALCLMLVACNHSQSQTAQANQASNDTKPEKATEPKQSPAYQQSDKNLTTSFAQLVAASPQSLQTDIKAEQAKWLKQRGQSCGVNGLAHPNNDKQEQCFITQNTQRITQLTRQSTMFKDLLNSQLTTLNKQNNKLEPTFEAHCYCGIDTPYLDSNKQRLNWQSSCPVKDESSKQSDTIKNMSLSENTLTLQLINASNKPYQVSFSVEPRKPHSYKLSIKNDTKALPDMAFESHVIPNKLLKVDTDKLCGDFEG